MKLRKTSHQPEKSMQTNRSPHAVRVSFRPRITVSIHDGSLQVDGIELSKYLKPGSVVVRPGDGFNPSEVTVTLLADTIRVDKSVATDFWEEQLA